MIHNVLEDAEGIEQIARKIYGDPADALARYGADLLGRAIGYEMRYEMSRGIDPTLTYSNLIHESIDHSTRRIMAFSAARKIAYGA